MIDRPLYTPITKIIVFILLLSTGAAFAGSGDLDFQIENGVIKVGPEKKPIETMTPAARAEFLQVLGDKLDDWKVRDQVAIALLMSHDTKSIQRLIDKYHSGDPGHISATIKSFGNEEVIPRLAGDIDDGKTKIPALTNPNGDIKHTSTFIVLRLIGDSTAFPDETKAWAKNLRYLAARYLDFVFPQVVNQFDEWWDHNRNAVVAKQYDQATWLPKEKLTQEKIQMDYDNRPHAHEPAAIPTTTTPPMLTMPPKTE